MTQQLSSQEHVHQQQKIVTMSQKFPLQLNCNSSLHFFHRDPLHLPQINQVSAKGFWESFAQQELNPCSLHQFHIYWAAPEGNTQPKNERQHSFYMYRYVKKRQNGRQNSQKALRVPFPLQWNQILQGGDGSFQVVWRTDLEFHLEKTQNYCLGLLALYLCQMII